VRLLLVLLLLTALVASPAAASGVDLPDRCGDAIAQVRLDGEEVSPSGDPLSPSYDIEHAALRSAWEGEELVGVDLSMQLCGDAVEPTFWQFYAWDWSLPQGCIGRVSVHGSATIGGSGGAIAVPVRASYTEHCPGTQVIGGHAPVYETRVSVLLDVATRVRMEGRSVQVALRAEDLGAAPLAVAAGTRWAEPRASARGVFEGGVGVRVGNGLWAQANPMGDSTAPGADFVVGS
jgi:hypothetical protein